MDRRDWLKVAGGTGIAAVGGFGAYTLFVREYGEPDRLPPPSADEDEDDLDTLIDQAETAPTRSGSHLLGVSPSSRDLTVLDPFESWLDRDHAVVGMFVDMGIESLEIDRHVYSLCESMWERGHIPHLFWQPYLPDPDTTSPEVIREIHEGDHDDTLEIWADALHNWATDNTGLDRRVYLNLAPEFNGDWSPWSPAIGDVTEADFVDMWRHVHDIVMDAGLERDHVQWIWTLDTTTRGVDREACYPGDDYVDWLGVHGYNWTNWGPWSMAEEIYGPTIDLLTDIADKPIAITEFGCSSELDDGSHDPERKDEWIADAIDYIDETDVKMALWFNINAETNWKVFDADPGLDRVEIGAREYEVYPAYRDGIQTNDTIPSHDDHPRRLTDEEFWGEF